MAVDKRTFLAKRDNPRSKAIAVAAYEVAMEQIEAGNDIEIEVREPRRTHPENRLLHALISELAVKLEWAGKRREPEVWKRLLVAAWCRESGSSVLILPALDGHGLDIVPVRTSRLSKRECAELIEFIYSWGADQGVRWAASEKEVA